MAAQARLATAFDRRGLSGPALRTFFRIAKHWSLSVEEQMTLLGLTARSTFFKWKKDPNTVLPKDTLERISYIVGVYKALQLLLPDETAADEWVKRPNTAPLFGGRSALDRMLSGRPHRMEAVLADHSQPVSAGSALRAGDRSRRP